ncbi:MAG: LPXTG cell wall anchor domain-containing protein [Lachnospiraceae bacterium]|nr:LPXTG cell wall anchor domain-containing protein [Lachnospiraceae bacterium]
MKTMTRTARLVGALLLALTLACGVSQNVCAADSASLDFTQTGSVSLTLADNDGNVMTDGAVTLYEVAALYLDDGSMAYEPTDVFADYTGDLDVEDTSLASALAEYIGTTEAEGITASIGEDGTVLFDELELGLYLVVQTTQSTGFATLSPFVVTLPSEESEAWVYAVDATPKVEVTVLPETPEEPTEEATTEAATEEEPATTTKTGKTTKTTGTTTTLPQTGQLNWPIPILAAGGLVLFTLGWVLVRTDKKKGHAA